MSKKAKFVRAQRPSGASTSAEHPSTAQQQGKKGQRKGASTSTIVGASLLAAGLGALAYLGRRNWPAIKQQAGKLKDQAGQATAGWQEQAGRVATDLKEQAGQVVADLKEQAGKLTANQQGGQQPEQQEQPEQKSKGGKAAGGSKGGQATGDAGLNEEVASATESSPGNEGKFTDEGATGNND